MNSSNRRHFATAICFALLTLLALSLPSAFALWGTHPSGPEEVHIVALGGGLSVGHKDVTFTVKIHKKHDDHDAPTVGNTIILTLSTYYDANHTIRYNPHTEHGAMINQQSTTVSLTENFYDNDEANGGGTITVTLDHGPGYYLYLIQAYNLQGQWLGQDWIDPREGPPG